MNPHLPVAHQVPPTTEQTTPSLSPALPPIPPHNPTDACSSTPTHTPPQFADTAIQSHLTQRTPPTTSYTSVSFRGPNGAVGPRDTHTHHFHWYPAKMFYRIPLQILDTLKPPAGATILDPFCGSGTVLVEALHRDLIAIGLDTNPIARLITKAKTTPLDRDQLSSNLTAILNTAGRLRRRPSDSHVPTFWFTPAARNALYRLHCAIRDLPDPHGSYRTFFLANLTSIVRSCSLADPTIPPPVKMRAERASKAGARYTRALETANSMTCQSVYRRFAETAKRNIDRLCTFRQQSSSSAIVLDGSALQMNLDDRAVDIVITSPPYCGAQKYIRSFRLELLLLGYTTDQIRALDRATLGAERSLWNASAPPAALTISQRISVARISDLNSHRARMLQLYLHNLDIFATELTRVLKPGGHAFITFGTSRFAGIPINLADCFADFASRAGLSVAARLRDPIPSRGMITKRNVSASVIQSDELLWLRHHD